MSGHLLDTNCISEVVRIQPDPRVIAWMDAADERTLYLSVFTLGEIRKGISSLTPGKRRTELEEWLDVDLRKRFAGRILPVDALIADRWGMLMGEMKRSGASIPLIDAVLAATALHYNLAVVSRNVHDFRNAKVQVINPWESL